jgi:hypothetical protein
MRNGYTSPPCDLPSCRNFLCRGTVTTGNTQGKASIVFSTNMDKTLLGTSLGLFLGCLLVTVCFPLTVFGILRLEASDS